MRVRVKLFATLQKKGLQGGDVELSCGATVQSLLNRLNIGVADVGILVVNARDATFDQVLKEADVVTIIPPIGGG